MNSSADTFFFNNPLFRRRNISKNSEASEISKTPIPKASQDCSFYGCAVLETKPLDKVTTVKTLTSKQKPFMEPWPRSAGHTYLRCAVAAQ